MADNVRKAVTIDFKVNLNAGPFRQLTDFARNFKDASGRVSDEALRTITAVTQASIAVATALGYVVRTTTQLATQAQEKFNVVWSLAGNKEVAENVRRSAENLSISFRASYNELMDGYEKLMNATLSARDATLVLSNALLLAKATGSPLVNTIDSLIIAYKNFGKSQVDITKLTGVVYTLWRSGVGDIQNLTKGLSDVAASAQATGLSFETLAATVGALSQQEIPVSKITTALRLVNAAWLRHSGKISETLSTIDKDLGASVAGAHTLEEAFEAISAYITKTSAAPDTIARIAQAFSSEARSLGTVISLFNRLPEITLIATEAQTGYVDALWAASIRMTSFNSTMQQILSSMQKLGRELGFAFLPSVQKFLQVASNILLVVVRFLTASKRVTTTITTLIISVGALAAVFSLLGVRITDMILWYEKAMERNSVFAKALYATGQQLKVTFSLLPTAVGAAVVKSFQLSFAALTQSIDVFRGIARTKLRSMAKDLKQVQKDLTPFLGEDVVAKLGWKEASKAWKDVQEAASSSTKSMSRSMAVFAASTKASIATTKAALHTLGAAIRATAVAWLQALKEMVVPFLVIASLNLLIKGWETLRNKIQATKTAASEAYRYLKNDAEIMATAFQNATQQLEETRLSMLKYAAVVDDYHKLVEALRAGHTEAAKAYFHDIQRTGVLTENQVTILKKALTSSGSALEAYLLQFETSLRRQGETFSETTASLVKAPFELEKQEVDKMLSSIYLKASKVGPNAIAAFMKYIPSARTLLMQATTPEEMTASLEYLRYQLDFLKASFNYFDSTQRAVMIDIDSLDDWSRTATKTIKTFSNTAEATIDSFALVSQKIETLRKSVAERGLLSTEEFLDMLAEIGKKLNKTQLSIEDVTDASNSMLNLFKKARGSTLMTDFFDEVSERVEKLVKVSTSLILVPEDIPKLIEPVVEVLAALDETVEGHKTKFVALSKELVEGLLSSAESFTATSGLTISEALLTVRALAEKYLTIFKDNAHDITETEKIFYTKYGDLISNQFETILSRLTDRLAKGAITAEQMVELYSQYVDLMTKDLPLEEKVRLIRQAILNIHKNAAKISDSEIKNLKIKNDLEEKRLKIVRETLETTLKLLGVGEEELKGYFDLVGQLESLVASIREVTSVRPTGLPGTMTDMMKRLLGTSEGLSLPVIYLKSLFKEETPGVVSLPGKGLLKEETPAPPPITEEPKLLKWPLFKVKSKEPTPLEKAAAEKSAEVPSWGREPVELPPETAYVEVTDRGVVFYKENEKPSSPFAMSRTAYEEKFSQRKNIIIPETKLPPELREFENAPPENLEKSWTPLMELFNKIGLQIRINKEEYEDLIQAVSKGKGAFEDISKFLSSLMPEVYKITAKQIDSLKFSIEELIKGSKEDEEKLRELAIDAGLVGEEFRMGIGEATKSSEEFTEALAASIKPLLDVQATVGLAQMALSSADKVLQQTQKDLKGLSQAQLELASSLDDPQKALELLTELYLRLGEASKRETTTVVDSFNEAAKILDTALNTAKGAPEALRGALERTLSGISKDIRKGIEETKLPDLVKNITDPYNEALKAVSELSSMTGKEVDLLTKHLSETTGALSSTSSLFEAIREIQQRSFEGVNVQAKATKIVLESYLSTLQDLRQEIEKMQFEDVEKQQIILNTIAALTNKISSQLRDLPFESVNNYQKALDRITDSVLKNINRISDTYQNIADLRQRAFEAASVPTTLGKSLVSLRTTIEVMSEAEVRVAEVLDKGKKAVQVLLKSLPAIAEVLGEGWEEAFAKPETALQRFLGIEKVVQNALRNINDEIIETELERIRVTKEIADLEAAAETSPTDAEDIKLRLKAKKDEQAALTANIEALGRQAAGYSSLQNLVEGLSKGTKEFVDLQKEGLTELETKLADLAEFKPDEAVRIFLDVTHGTISVQEALKKIEQEYATINLKGSLYFGILTKIVDKTREWYNTSKELRNTANELAVAFGKALPRRVEEQEIKRELQFLLNSMRQVLREFETVPATELFEELSELPTELRDPWEDFLKNVLEKNLEQINSILPESSNLLEVKTPEFDVYIAKIKKALLAISTAVQKPGTPFISESAYNDIENATDAVTVLADALESTLGKEAADKFREAWKNILPLIKDIVVKHTSYIEDLNSAISEHIEKSAATLRAKYKELGLYLSDLYKTIAESFQSAFSEALGAVVFESENVGKALLNMYAKIMKAIADMMIEIVAKWVTEKVFLKGLNFLFPGLQYGGEVKKRPLGLQHGGEVEVKAVPTRTATGYAPGIDRVPAVLTPGEWVIPASVASFLKRFLSTARPKISAGEVLSRNAMKAIQSVAAPKITVPSTQVVVERAETRVTAPEVVHAPAPTVNIHIEAVDAKGVADLFYRNRDTLGDVLLATKREHSPALKRFR